MPPRRKIIRQATTSSLSKSTQESVYLAKFSPEEEKAYREVFDMFDADGGGAIDCDEVAAMMAILGYKMSDQEVAELVAEVDWDHDGQIDFQARRACPPSATPPAPPLARAWAVARTSANSPIGPVRRPLATHRARQTRLEKQFLPPGGHFSAGCQASPRSNPPSRRASPA